MAYRIRVHPQIGAAGAYGAYGAGGLANQQYYQQELKNEKTTSALRLNFERALWQEKLKFAQLQAAAAQPQVAGGYGPYGGVPFGMPGVLNAGIPGAIPIGGMGLPGSGQMNVTTQTAAGAGNQSVSNSNTFSSYTMGGTGFGMGFPFGGHPGYGYPPTPYGPPAGGFLGGLLGAFGL